MWGLRDETPIAVIEGSLPQRETDIMGHQSERW